MGGRFSFTLERLASPRHRSHVAQLFSLGHYHIMRNTLTLLLSMIAVMCLAQEQTASTRSILPTDVVQESIQLVRFSTNSFAVRFTYTEAGAKKALAFWEAHPSPGVTYSAQWKDGWLKRRTDKGFFKTEESAKSFIAEIKSK